MRTRMRFAIFAFLISCCVLAGCAARQKNISNLPAGVTQTQVQNWDMAVADLDKIAQSTSALRQAVIGLNRQGVIPDGTVYVAILTSLGKIDQAQIDAAAFLKAQPNNWGVSTQAKVKNDLAIISAELTNITQQQLAGIKNPGAQAQVTQLIAEVTAVVNLVLSLTS